MKNILTQEEIDSIKEICARHKITKYTINNDGTIDVQGNVGIQGMTTGMLPLRFNRVLGNFNCMRNKLTTLVGAPVYVGGHMHCHNNQLTTLEHCPSEVIGLFNCADNNLTSLQYCPISPNMLICGGRNNLHTLDYYPTNLIDKLKTSVAEFTKAYRPFAQMTFTERKIFIKYQDDYEVWTPEFNKENFDILKEDVLDGLQ